MATLLKVESLLKKVIVSIFVFIELELSQEKQQSCLWNFIYVVAVDNSFLQLLYCCGYDVVARLLL